MTKESPNPRIKGEVLEIRCSSDIPFPGLTVTSAAIDDPRFKGLGLTMRLHRAGVQVSCQTKDWHAIIPYSAVKFIRVANAED